MTDPTNAHTLLSIAGIGVQPYSCRGAQQTLSPITQANNSRRDVNGNLLDISFDGFKKFATTINCADQTAPALDGVWPGLTLVIDCIEELCYLTAGGTPSRTVVDGSSRTDGDFTFYRPQITFMVLTWSAQEDEYGAQVSWNMTAEEV
jgi:hypothetical protein